MTANFVGIPASFLGTPFNQEMNMKISGDSERKSKGNSSTSPVRRSKKSDTSFGNDDFRRERMIAEAAYYLSKKRGFAPENDMADWLQAEAEVEVSLRSGQ